MKSFASTSVLFLCLAALAMFGVGLLDSDMVATAEPESASLEPAIVRDAEQDRIILDAILYGSDPVVWVSDEFWEQPDVWRLQLLSSAWAFSRRQGGDPLVVKVMDGDDHILGEFDGAQFRDMR